MLLVTWYAWDSELGAYVLQAAVVSRVHFNSQMFRVDWAGDGVGTIVDKSADGSV